MTEKKIWQKVRAVCCAWNLSFIDKSYLISFFNWYVAVLKPQIVHYRKKSGAKRAITAAFALKSFLMSFTSCFPSTTAWNGIKEVCLKNDSGTTLSAFNRSSWWRQPMIVKTGNPLQKMMSDKNPRVNKLPIPKRANDYVEINWFMNYKWLIIHEILLPPFLPWRAGLVWF